MKFNIDAQLPYGLKSFFCRKGFDAIHTDDLPRKEKTTDNEIRKISQKENRIVVTKDSDFLDSFYVKGYPEKLLLISTGNIRNRELFELFTANITVILELLGDCNLVEVSNEGILGYQ